MKELFIKILSIGVEPQMDENKKNVIQVATFDGIGTMITMLVYLVFTFFNFTPFLSLLFGFGVLLMCFGLWLMHGKHHDAARAVLHLTALAQIFITADTMGPSSGYEFYYFTSVTIPFITFTVEEQKKGFILTGIALAVLITQQILGPGLFFDYMPASDHDRLFALVVVMVFMIAVLSVSRWQMDITQKQIRLQQGELIHTSNLKALGEMAGGIAHEINNPLQTLSLQSRALRSSFTDMKSLPPVVTEQLDTVESTITKIAKLVKGLRDLTRDVANDPVGYFFIKEALDDVMSVSSEKVKNLGITMEVRGDTDLAVHGHMVQVSQVLINLLNNSIDALANLESKWIVIDVKEIRTGVCLEITDSGPGIPKAIAEKLMLPFFTTKPPGKGTGLGLSISKSIIERNGGRFFLDTKAAHTKFVIELPGVTETA